MSRWNSAFHTVEVRPREVIGDERCLITFNCGKSSSGLVSSWVCGRAVGSRACAKRYPLLFSAAAALPCCIALMHAYNCAPC